MKIISFLGLNSYKVTNYQDRTNSENPEVYQTKYYQEALAYFYEPEILYVFLTETVEKQPPRDEDRSNWVQLQERFSRDFPHIKLEPIKNIPERNSPDDVWTIFSRINECLEEGDRVIFDITHSFRSVPIVALLSVSYFRVVRNITIEGLLYGAFEAKENGITPTFDLLPVVRLLDWLTATDQFIKTGNGRDLSALLQSSGTETKQLGKRIEEISQDLQLLRPMNLMQASAALPEDIELAMPHITRVVPPFESLVNRIVEEYGKFALKDATNYKDNAKLALSKKIDAIEWYAEKGLEVQALSLTREWLPSLLCYHFNLDPMNKAEREEMEILCAGGKLGNRESKYRSQYQEIPKSLRSPINRVWNHLANLRNDVLHAGFRPNPRSSNEISDETQDVITEVKKIAKDWQILGSET
ncbi:CRISPR-associated protein [Geitlerinema sp. FC II]|nr:CRISPR-associated protein [Geitlerinema sp. FC II]